MMMIMIINNSFLLFILFIYQVYLLRKMASNRIGTKNRRFYICSLSCETIVYKVNDDLTVRCLGKIYFILQ